jgi:hypothetical protein
MEQSAIAIIRKTKVVKLERDEDASKDICTIHVGCDRSRFYTAMQKLGRNMLVD